MDQHLAVLGNPRAPVRARELSQDTLLTALSGGYDVETRLDIAEKLVGKIDVSLNSLLISHLESLRMEALELGQEGNVVKADRLLKELEVSEE